MFVRRRVKSSRIPASLIPYYWAIRRHFQALVAAQGHFLILHHEYVRYNHDYQLYGEILSLPQQPQWLLDPWAYRYSDWVQVDDVLYDILHDIMVLIWWYGIELW